MSMDAFGRGETSRQRRDAAAAMRGRALLVVANRGPVEFTQREDGGFSARPGAGGLVTALYGCLRALPHLDVTWVAIAMTDGDRAAFAEPDTTRTIELAGRPVRLKYVHVPIDVYRQHYDVISNQVLWLLQHHLWSPEHMGPFSNSHRQAWTDGYGVVNRALAEAAAREARRARESDPRPPVIVVQDYQLYLAPGEIRRLVPDAVLAAFCHIPWPAVRYWLWLPHQMLLDIYTSLAQCDLFGLQTPQDGTNFLQAASDVLRGSRVSLDRGEIAWQGGILRVGVYPVTIDAGAARHAAQAAAQAKRAGTSGARKTIVRVDRLEPTKNIIGGFLAYRKLLRDHRELRGKVCFRAFLVPSRQTISIYKAHRQHVLRLARDINRYYGTARWQPIALVLGNDRPRALAALREADVVLVNPLVDGMNLVAKEAAVVNERDGVLVLSRVAGAYRELSDACLAVTPTDVDETAWALYEALMLGAKERHALAANARKIVEEREPAAWLIDQIADALAAREHANRQRGARKLARQRGDGAKMSRRRGALALDVGPGDGEAAAPAAP